MRKIFSDRRGFNFRLLCSKNNGYGTRLAALCGCLYFTVALVCWLDLAVINTSDSTPHGLYIRSDQNGNYVTFCLTSKHSNLAVYNQACHADNPDGIRILKKISEMRRDGYWVISGHPLAVDSRRVGVVNFNQVLGRWKLIWDWKATING